MEPNFFDRDAEDRGATYDRAERETGRNWHDLDGEERAFYMYGSDDGGDW